MGQQVGVVNYLVAALHPKPSDLTVSRSRGVNPEGLIRARRKVLK